MSAEGRAMSGWRWVIGATAGAGLLAVGLAAPGLAPAQSQPKLPSPPPTPRTPAAAAPAPAAPAAPAPVPAPAAEAPAGGRDPFSPLVRPQSDEERQAQEISGLRLVGVVWDPKARDQIRALVQTPDGLGYYLRVNDEKFGGTVTTIERDRVQFSVKETLPGGQVRTRTVELRLP
jgi:hypothetical protein